MEKLIERIKKIESLIKGAKTEGEKNAAKLAKERLLKKYPKLDIEKNIIEYSLRTPDYWHKQLLIAICRKYGLKPFRYKRQKYTTEMVNVYEEFLNEVVWKEYLEYSNH